MSARSFDELIAFHEFVAEKVQSGRASLSPEEVLDEWRSLHPDPGAGTEDVAAIEEAIADQQRGDLGVPFEEFDREFRARRNPGS